MKYLFLVLVLLLPTQLGKHWWPEWSLVDGVRVDYLSPTVFLTDIVLFLILIIFLIEKLRNPKSEIRNPKQIRNSKFKTISLLLVACYLLLVTLFSSRPWLAVLWVARYLEIPLVAFLTIKIRRIRRATRLRLPFAFRFYSNTAHGALIGGRGRTRWEIPTALAIAIMFSVGLGAAQMVLGRTTGWFWWLGERNFNLATPGVATMTILGREILRPYATFGHPNALAGFLAAGFWLMEGPAQLSTRLFGTIRSRLVLRFGRGSGVPADFCRAKIRVRPKRTGWIINTGKAAAAIGVIMTGSRGAILGLVIATLLNCYIVSGIGRIKSRWLLGIAIISSLVIGYWWNNINKLVIFANESSTERNILNHAAIKMWKENWVMGVGPGQFLARMTEYLPAGFYKIQPVHNVFLLGLAEFGVMGGLIWLIGLICLIWQIKRNKQVGKWAPVLAVIFVTGMVDHYWLTAQQNRLLLGVILGMLISSWRRRSICDCGLRLRNR